MTSFKKVQTEFVDAKYEGGIKIFLESAEDVRIFSEHWFSHKQDKLRFVSAEGNKSGGGGCQAVISKVNESNRQNIKAYGLIDRDTLLACKNYDLFWETDDTKFHSARPYGENIYVLRRWELENYLLQPEAFSEEISRRIVRSPAPAVSAETFLILADDIIQVTALTTLSVANDKHSPNPAFGTNIPSNSTLAEEINKFLKRQFPANNFDLCNDVEKIKTFDQNNITPSERWERLSRILDGKKSLMRICRHLSMTLSLSSIEHWEEMRGCLANMIASRRSIDCELVNFIESL